MRALTIAAVCVLGALASPVPARAQAAASISTRTAGLQRTDGFIPFYWDASKGRILFEVPSVDADVLYFVSTAASPGSVELGMDRGVDAQKVVHFHRIGPKVLVVEQNLAFRALSGSAALKENVRDSFASSVLASLPIEAEEAGRVLIDATSLVVRDALGIEASLRSLDQERSGSIPRAARSTLHARKLSRRTPKWKRSSPSRATTQERWCGASHPTLRH